MITTLLILGAIVALLYIKYPDLHTRIGYRVRYERNRFYKEVLNKCPHCKQTLSRTGTGRGICTNDKCFK